MQPVRGGAELGPRGSPWGSTLLPGVSVPPGQGGKFSRGLLQNKPEYVTKTGNGLRATDSTVHVSGTLHWVLASPGPAQEDTGWYLVSPRHPSLRPGCDFLGSPR